MVDLFQGTWKSISCENCEEYMKELVSHIYLRITASKSGSFDSTELALCEPLPSVFHIETINIDLAPRYSSVQN